MKQKSKLKYEEYQAIYEKHEKEMWGIRRISRYLGRSPSTISRFLNKKYDICSGVWREMSPYEKALYAWSEGRKLKTRNRFRLKTNRIRKLVVHFLCKHHWSPEIISRILNKHGLYISAKSIYSFIKIERKELVKYLRLRGKQRKQRVCHPRGLFKTGAPPKRNISLRPEILEEGHWEIDTIHSRRGSNSGVLTLKERKSMRAYFFLIKDRKADTVTKIVLPFFQRLPSHMRKTLTTDNGSEFQELFKLEKVVPETMVYYCDAYKSWQKGAVEQSNMELRWYFPKGTDFSNVSKVEFDKAVSLINSKPRESLRDKSSKKMFNELLEAA